MLDMGFIPDVRKILRHLPPPGSRQTLLFSATLSPTVKRLANQWTRDPLELTVNPEELTVDSIQQVNITVREQEKLPVLVDLLNHWNNPRVLVFTNRKISAELLCKKLARSKISAAFLSGDVSQKRRISILDGFKKGTLNVLVATDLASRGIHVDNISLVINYDIPYEPEAYVHRIGRTARSGKEGVAINFVCEVGGFYMADVENLLGKSIESLTHHELFDRLKELVPPVAEKKEEIRPRVEKLEGERKKAVPSEHQTARPSIQLESTNPDLDAVRNQPHPPAASPKRPKPPAKTKSALSRRRKTMPPGGHDRAFNRAPVPERENQAPADSKPVQSQSPKKDEGARGKGSRRRRNHRGK
jgi:ATP-dependent RNA helicase RhlB